MQVLFAFYFGQERRGAVCAVPHLAVWVTRQYIDILVVNGGNSIEERKRAFRVCEHGLDVSRVAVVAAPTLALAAGLVRQRKGVNQTCWPTQAQLSRLAIATHSRLDESPQ